VAILEIDPCRRLPGAVDVHGCQLIPDASASGVQLAPDGAALVETHFEVMIPTAECAELLDRALLLLRRERFATPVLRVVVTKPGCCDAGARVRAASASSWDSTLDLSEQGIQVPGKLPRVDVRLDSDDSAADVDADGGRNYCIAGRDHGADGGTDTEMRVGHERNVSFDDR